MKVALMALALLSLALIVPTSTVVRGDDVDSSRQNMIPDFSAKVPRVELDEKVNSLSEYYYRLGDVLNAQLGNKDVPDDHKVYVIYLIGLYKYQGAVPILFDNIDYEEPLDEGSVKPDFRMKKWGMYPAAEALVKIGKPASIESIARLAVDDGTAKTKYRGFYTTKRELYLFALRSVEGDDVARFMLQNAIEKEQDKDKKANLTAALELLDKWIKEDADLAKQQENPPAPPADGDATPPASGLDESVVAPQEASRKTIFEKYLANGDLVTMTVEEQSVKPEEREKKGDIVRTYSLHLTQNGKKDSVSMNWQKIVSVTLNQGEVTWNSKVSMYDAIIVGSKYYIFYTYYSDICIDTIEQQDGVFKVTGTTRLRNQASGEKVTNGYLAVLGNRAHALIEYLIGTQELWRLDEDKPTRLWRLDYEELQRQKGQGATPPAEGGTNPPADNGTAPPAEGNTSSPASGGTQP